MSESVIVDIVLATIKQRYATLVQKITEVSWDEGSDQVVVQALEDQEEEFVQKLIEVLNIISTLKSQVCKTCLKRQQHLLFVHPTGLSHCWCLSLQADSDSLSEQPACKKRKPSSVKAATTPDL